MTSKGCNAKCMDFIDWIVRPDKTCQDIMPNAHSVA